MDHPAAATTTSSSTSTHGAAPRRKPLVPRRPLDSIIIHFDYDCFYASVFEHENPALKSLPLAVQQKQIVVTCNYEARRRGLYKLQLIKDAKRACPDAVIVLGEDLTRFRNASKELYAFLTSFSWNARCERLGFDEVFMDVSDIIDYNVALLNHKNLTNSFFCLSKHDPTVGFQFNAAVLAGQSYPETSNDQSGAPLDSLRLRLHTASHLAQFLRKRLDSEKGYTCTVGVSTNKLLSKLVGSLHKPNNQTTLLPPYNSDANDESGSDNVTSFMDGHEIGKIPGIGFKIAQRLRAHVLQRPANFDTGLVYGGTEENVLVADVRKHPHMSPERLEQLLGGQGAPQGIGAKIWGLLNGYDETEVGQARQVPKQISIEDSYIRLDTLKEVTKEMDGLARNLIQRMHQDLLEDDGQSAQSLTSRRWVAHPRNIRLSTRPRPPQNPDGSRNRSFARISRSAPMPNFIFNLKESVGSLADRLVSETLIPLFRKLHPEKSGWNLSLVNVAAVNVVEGASEKGGGVGRDIGKMFKHQDEVLRPVRLEDRQEAGVSAETEKKDKLPERKRSSEVTGHRRGGTEDLATPSQELGYFSDGNRWESEDESQMDSDSYRCDDCGAVMPVFALAAHHRWHLQN